LPEKLTKFRNFTRFLPEKNARLHNKTTILRPGRGQMFKAEAEAEAEAKSLRPRPKLGPNFWPRGLNITAGVSPLDPPS